MDETTGVTATEEGTARADDDAILAVEDLSKEFGGFFAVDGFDLEVRPGEVHGLIGPNGAGKTTSFNLITGELTPTTGTVWFKGRDVTGMSPSKLTGLGMGRSFQDIQYFPEMTVREHFYLAARERSRLGRGRDREAAEAVVEDVAARVKLDDQLTTRATNLSHGQRRSLDIGMVLCLDPELVLFDEPAAGLNVSETGLLQEIMEGLDETYSMLVIEHNIGLVQRLADRITVLHQGKNLATGTPEEITEDERVREVYLGA